MNFTKFSIYTIISVVIVGCASSLEAKDRDKLVFNPAIAQRASLTMPSGEDVRYTAYENIFYVSNIEDSVYQTLNIYVPETLKNGNMTPIFLPRLTHLK